LAVLLVLACLPQLLHNSSRPLVPLKTQPNSTLAPYFLVRLPNDPNLAILRDLKAYENAVDTVVRSGCTRVGFANWILFEYPLWAGLRLHEWQGEIQDVDVSNESARYEPATFEPCALVRQATGLATSGDRSWAAFRFGPLAVSLAPSALAGVDPPVGFTSDAGGVAAFPGAGWTTTRVPDPGSVGVFASGADLVLRAAAPGTYVVRIRYVAADGVLITCPRATRISQSDDVVELTVRLSAGVSTVPLLVTGATEVEARQVTVGQVRR
jgi:hypothetical protein